MRWINMKCLVTGGGGFVGRALVRRLLSDGHDVVAVDSLVAEGSHAPDMEGPHPGRLTFAWADCRDWFRMHPDQEFDRVYHLAAVVGGRQMIDNSPIAVAADLAIDADFWNWAVATRPGMVAYFSSSAAYPVACQRAPGMLHEDLIDWTNIGLPDMTYGWAKLTGEYLARLAAERHGLRTVCFRPFSGYGEEQAACYPMTALCGRVLDAQRSGAHKVTVWGTGKQVRDFIHIDDCVAAIVEFTIGNAIILGPVNLCTGIGTSFVDLAHVAARILGIGIEVEQDLSKPVGVAYRVGDPKRQATWGFRPRIDLETGVRRVLAHLENNMNNGENRATC